MELRVNELKYQNTYFLIIFYVLLSFLHFNYIISFQDFNYVAYYRNIEFDFSIFRFIVASIVIFGNIFFLLFFKMSDFLYSILILILFFFVIPSGLVFSSGKSIYPIILILHNIFFYCVYLFSLIKWKFGFPTFKIKQTITLLGILTIIGVIPFVIEYGPYINFKNLLLVDVYKTRTLVFNNINNLYTAYTYSLFSKVVIPILIVFSIYYRSYSNLFINILILLFLYLCGAHKMVFIGTIFLLLFYKYDYLRKIKYFLKFMTLLIIVSMISSILFNYDYIWDISFRRVLMLTALLDYCYFDFFKDNPIYWSNSFLSSFSDYKYDLTPDHMIAKVYFNKPEVNANIGIISDGFKNLGVYGSLLNIIFVSLYFSILNSIKVSSKFFGLFVLLVFSFLNSSLTTILLTHGGIFLLLLSVLILRNTNQKMDLNI